MGDNVMSNLNSGFNKVSRPFWIKLDNSGKQVVDTQAMLRVGWMHLMFQDGWELQKIADAYNSVGHRDLNGALYSYSTIFRILLDHRAIGCGSAIGEGGDSIWEPIMTDEFFYSSQDAMQELPHFIHDDQETFSALAAQ